jgi:hypothetical protein
MRVLGFALLLALFGVALSACDGGALLSDVAVSAPALRPTGAGEHVDVSYRIGRPAKVSIYLQDANGARYTLRDGEPRDPSSDPYVLRLDGTAPTGDPVLKRRALPSGDYAVVVQAVGADGSQAEERREVAIQGADVQPPLVENLVVVPPTISPNADAVDDVAELTYGLPVSATVNIDIRGPGCRPACPFITADEEGPEASTPTLCAPRIATATWSNNRGISRSPAAGSPRRRSSTPTWPPRRCCAAMC